MKNWEALIPSRRKEILRYFARLKSKEARARNLDRALHVLSGRRGRLWGARGMVERSLQVLRMPAFAPTFSQ